VLALLGPLTEAFVENFVYERGKFDRAGDRIFANSRLSDGLQPAANQSERLNTAREPMSCLEAGCKLPGGGRGMRKWGLQPATGNFIHSTD
jgi:hypothetical protein